MQGREKAGSGATPKLVRVIDYETTGLPDSPAAEVIELAQLPRDNVEFLVLGTTLGTNAVLEGKCARTGMITTAGFRDVIELARQRRPDYFNLDKVKPVPPASRDCRCLTCCCCWTYLDV